MLQYYEPEKDYGTAPVVSEESVTVSIDGVAIEVPAGTSVMRAVM